MNLLFLGGGLWIILVLTGGGGLWFLYQSYKASKSGTERLPNSSGKRPFQSDQNLPIWKTGGKFYFAVALLVATVVIFFIMKGDK